MKDPVFARLLSVAESAGVTLGAAESLTGGLFGYSLSRAPGAAGTFCGSIVSYSSEVKHRLLEVPSGPVVSAEAAIAMAASARLMLACDIAVSLTGVAGPETQDGMPIGTVFMALADRGEPPISHELRLDGSPDQIRQGAAVTAAQAMLDRIAP